MSVESVSAETFAEARVIQLNRVIANNSVASPVSCMMLMLTIIKGLRVMSRFFVRALEGFGPGEKIVHARDDCESKCKVEGDVAEETNNIIIEHLVSENGDKGGHLDCGFQLAEE